MTPLNKRNKLALILGVAVICTVLVIFAYTRNSSSTQVATNTGSGTSTIPASSTGQSVDSGLSLSPSDLLAKQSPTKTPKPTAAQTGCRMELDFNIASGTASAGGTASYMLVAKNLGSAACNSASISVYYGSNESFNTASPKATAAGYYWNIGTLVPGNIYSVALTTNLTSGTAAASTNEACLSASNGSDACANVGSSASSPVNVVASSPTVGGTSPSVIGSNGLVSTTPTPASTPTTVPANTNSYTPVSGQEFGVWEWTTISQMSSADMQNIVNEASVNHFNVIYLTVDDYLSIAAQPVGPAKTTALATYNSNLEMFLMLAKSKGIAVDAESGARDWAQPANITNAPRILAFVAAFNQTNSVKFRGVQYDIEPYLLDQYNTDPGTVLTQYVQLIDSVVQQDKYDALPLTIVVPHFFDSGVKWTPTVTVDGVTNYTFEQIVRLLNELPAGDGRTIVMAYRNFAVGADGSIALSSQEVHDADTTNVKVLVAQETGPVTPSYVTFNGLTRSALFAQLALINQGYASDRSFAGTAVDYLDPFLNLQ